MKRGRERGAGEVRDRAREKEIVLIERDRETERETRGEI